MPDEVVPMPDGGFYIAMMGSATGGSPGTIARFDKDMKLIGERQPRGLELKPVCMCVCCGMGGKRMAAKRAPHAWLRKGVCVSLWLAHDTARACKPAPATQCPPHSPTTPHLQTRVLHTAVRAIVSRCS